MGCYTGTEGFQRPKVPAKDIDIQFKFSTDGGAGKKTK